MTTVSGNATHGSSGPIDVDLKQVVFALSEMLDLVGVDDVAHGKRVGIMAAECARVLGLDESEAGFLFNLGMLHDIGVSSTMTHSRLLRKFEWESSQEHCVTGQERLLGIRSLKRLATPVRYHHTRWDQLVGREDIAPRTAEYANLIYLVDRVDALLAPFYTNGGYLMYVAAIRHQIGELAGRHFSQRLVKAFLAASAAESFWLQLEPRGMQTRLDALLAREQMCRVAVDELMQLTTLFACIVDAKSPYTANHSLGVSRLARLFAERLGIDSVTCDKLQIAGLLHDLGKLRIPDEILDKPAALDERERTIIHTHSFETFRILHHVNGFDEITPWAAYHHEQPDGSGYPFHLHGEMLSLEARIVRVADIFQAMSQDRPYRAGLPATTVVDYLRQLAARQNVDSRIVDAINEDIPGTLEAAAAPT